jgi:hypothetical protein
MTLRNLEENTVGSRECGKIRIGYLVLVLFLAVFGYLAYRIVPVYTQQDAFDDDLRSLAGTATRRGWDTSEIVNQVRKLGKTRNFQIRARDIRVRRARGRPEVNLEVNYTRSEEFPGGYVYVFSFSSSSEGSFFF